VVICRTVGPMDEEVTELLDLSSVSLAGLRDMPDEVAAEFIEAAGQQVERPRPNLGGGPPGRAD
jgi:hypothetical protein